MCQEISLVTLQFKDTVLEKRFDNEYQKEQYKKTGFIFLLSGSVLYISTFLYYTLICKPSLTSLLYFLLPCLLYIGSLCLWNNTHRWVSRYQYTFIILFRLLSNLILCISLRQLSKESSHNNKFMLAFIIISFIFSNVCQSFGLRLKLMCYDMILQTVCCCLSILYKARLLSFYLTVCSTDGLSTTIVWINYLGQFSWKFMLFSIGCFESDLTINDPTLLFILLMHLYAMIYLVFIIILRRDWSNRKNFLLKINNERNSTNHQSMRSADSLHHFCFIIMSYAGLGLCWKSAQSLYLLMGIQDNTT